MQNLPALESYLYMDTFMRVQALIKIKFSKALYEDAEASQNLSLSVSSLGCSN